MRVAKRIGRTLAVQWFETKLDPDSSTTLAADALLSDRRCQLVGGYPLVESALGTPGMKSARLPDFVGARPADRGRSIELGTLVPSRAYHFAALTVVLAPRSRCGSPIWRVSKASGSGSKAARSPTRY